MAGRRPKPTEMKKLAGNPGKRRLNEKEPKPAQTSARLPYGRLPADGKRLWKAIAPLLKDLKVLTEADLPALEMLCNHYAVARKALIMLDEEGITAESETQYGSTIKKHPAASVFRENSTAFRMYLTEFGLTPASRVRLKIDSGEEEKSLAEMLFEAVNG